MDHSNGDVTATATELVLREVHDGVCVLTLNRPDRMNAWTQQMEERYFDLLEGADRDREVRAIVVTGAGRGFCPGFDMDALAAFSGGEAPAPEAPRRAAARPRHVDRPAARSTFRYSRSGWNRQTPQPSGDATCAS